MTLKHIPEIGDRFGRLTVASEVFYHNKRRAVLCLCDCGVYSERVVTQIFSGKTKSCGCLVSETKSNLTHGGTGTRLYKTFHHMLRRCRDQRSNYYKNYGGRGIVVCEEWAESFEVFRDWALANGYQEHLTIDRVNNDGNYEPSNCRWITLKENSRNRRSNRFAEIWGEIKCINEWTEDSRCVVTRGTVWSRINRDGWTYEQAITIPTKRGPHHLNRGAGR